MSLKAVELIYGAFMKKTRFNTLLGESKTEEEAPIIVWFEIYITVINFACYVTQFADLNL